MLLFLNDMILFIIIIIIYIYRKSLNELSHHIFTMLYESNKLREHQARETLISVLEEQLQQRQALVYELRTNIQKASDALQKI